MFGLPEDDMVFDKFYGNYQGAALALKSQLGDRGRGLIVSKNEETGQRQLAIFQSYYTYTPTEGIPREINGRPLSSEVSQAWSKQRDLLPSVPQYSSRTAWDFGPSLERGENWLDLPREDLLQIHPLVLDDQAGDPIPELSRFDPAGDYDPGQSTKVTAHQKAVRRANRKSKTNEG